MNRDEAIRRAIEEVTHRGTAVTKDAPTAIFKGRDITLGKNRSGWIVIFRLDVPDDFKPNVLHVEVYEPDGEVFVPPLF